MTIFRLVCVATCVVMLVGGGAYAALASMRTRDGAKHEEADTSEPGSVPVTNA